MREADYPRHGIPKMMRLEAAPDLDIWVERVAPEGGIFDMYPKLIGKLLSGEGYYEDENGRYWIEKEWNYLVEPNVSELCEIELREDMKRKAAQDLSEGFF